MNADNRSKHGDFQRHMITHIRRHFSDVLGEHAHLLDESDGLDRLAELIRTGEIA